MRRTLLTLSLASAIAGVGGYTATVASATGASNREIIAKDMPSYRDVVKRVLPAVVSVEAKTTAKAATVKRPQGDTAPFENMPGLPDEFRRFFEQMPRQTPAPHGHAFGSGFVVDPSGIVLTNEHVVRGADEVEVKFPDGRKFTSRDIKRDAKTDLAIIRIKSDSPLPSLTLANSDECEVGDRVLAIGAPLGLAGSVTHGIISAKARDMRMNTYEDFLQTDAAINPGNSGGPLVNLAGEVVGVNSAIKSRTGGFQGIGLAIASNLVKSVKDPLLANGSVPRGYLGVAVAPLEPEVATKLGVKAKGGVTVAKVTPGSPAAKAGMQDGDVIVEVAGKAVPDGRHLQQIVAGLRAGKTAEIAVVRDGNRKVLTVTVEEQPNDFGSASESVSPEPGKTTFDKIGASASELTAEKAKELGFSSANEGVLLTEVAPDGVAANAGLRAGVVVEKVDGTRVRSVAELQKALDAGSLEKGILLQVKAPQSGTAFVLLKSAAK